MAGQHFTTAAHCTNRVVAMGTFELNAAIAGGLGRVETDRCGVSQSPRELLREVWDEAASELSRLVRAMGIERDSVEDVLQDVYLTAWQKRPCGADRIELRRWLFRITVNRCNLRHRRKKRWRSVLTAVTRHWIASPAENEAEEIANRNEERKLVHQALDALEPHLRSVLVLRYFLELDSKEIGRVLDVPDSTVRSQLHSGRKRLAQALRQAGYSDE